MASKKERKLTKDQELQLLKQNVQAMRSTFVEMFDAMEARIDHLLPEPASRRCIIGDMKKYWKDEVAKWKW